MKKFITFLLLTFFYQSLIADQILIPLGSSWKYLDNGSNQGTAWRSTAFNDATWASGNAQLGYGDGDEATVVNSGGSVKFITTYFRKAINISSIASFTGYSIRYRRDDGIVIYVNGNEVFRNNMPSGTISFTTVASSTVSDDGNTLFTASISGSSFVNGSNVVAVEIHQRSTSSSDISFDMELKGIEPAGTCSVPSGLSASSLTTTSALLSWSAVSSAGSYNLQWKPASSTTWTTINAITTTSFTLNGLSAGISYNYRVQSVCGTTTSAYSASGTFTTPATNPVNEVIYQWSGAIQPTSAVVVAKLTSNSSTCRLVVSTSSALSNPLYSAFASASTSNNRMAKMTVTGLTPGTTYFYAIESGGVVDNSTDDIGKFSTPSATSFSFRFTVGSCAVSSNHQVYNLMANKQPLFHMATGDFHYANPNSSSNINVHRLPYENNMLSQTPSRNFLKNTALAFIWDDHDYCGNNSGGNSSGKANARQAYQEYVPHYPLAAGTGNVPIYQAFTIGRVHFILSDLRSERVSGTMMGSTQKQWFKNQCIFARNNNLIIAWVSSVSFGGNQSDNWGGFSAERTELSNFFRDNSIRNMFILSGDAHMLAIDNGSNHDFSTGSNNAFDYPVFQAAAVNNSGSTKGGTYSEGGTFPNPNSSTGQYGVVDISDNGGSSVTITFTGYRTSGNTTTESVLRTYTFTRNLTGTPRLASPGLSLRSTEQGRKVQVSWDFAPENCHLLVSRNHADFSTFSDRVVGTGTSVDHHANSGWNTYRLTNQNGEILAENEIYISGQTTLGLYPNPASDQLTISLAEVPFDMEARYIVYNEKMKASLQDQLSLKKGSNEFSLDISSLESGNYVVHVVLNGIELSGKLLVVR